MKLLAQQPDGRSYQNKTDHRWLQFPALDTPYFGVKHLSVHCKQLKQSILRREGVSCVASAFLGNLFTIQSVEEIRLLEFFVNLISTVLINNDGNFTSKMLLFPSRTVSSVYCAQVNICNDRMDSLHQHALTEQWLRTVWLGVCG